MSFDFWYRSSDNNRPMTVRPIMVGQQGHRRFKHREFTLTISLNFVFLPDRMIVPASYTNVVIDSIRFNRLELLVRDGVPAGVFDQKFNGSPLVPGQTISVVMKRVPGPARYRLHIRSKGRRNVCSSLLAVPPGASRTTIPQVAFAGKCFDE